MRGDGGSRDAGCRGSRPHHDDRERAGGVPGPIRARADSLPPTLEQFGGDRSSRSSTRPCRGRWGSPRRGIALAKQALHPSPAARQAQEVGAAVARAGAHASPSTRCRWRSSPVARAAREAVPGRGGRRRGDARRRPRQRRRGGSRCHLPGAGRPYRGIHAGGRGFERQAATEEFGAEQEAARGRPVARATVRAGPVRTRHHVDWRRGKPHPMVEQFVPAILSALRLGIRIVGVPCAW